MEIDKRAVASGVVLIIAVWGASGFLIKYLFGDYVTSGQFGDMFGAINALFSGLALAAVVVTLILQKHEIAKQKEDLANTLIEMKRSSESQLRSLHNELIKISLTDNELWPDHGMHGSRIKQYHFIQLMYFHLQTLFRLKEITEENLSRELEQIFSSSLGKQFWLQRNEYIKNLSVDAVAQDVFTIAIKVYNRHKDIPSTNFPYYRINAFAITAEGGNPAGVVIYDSDLEETWMQDTASSIGLSETSFVRRKDNGRYSLRWFTPIKEINLCGHATLAAAYALWYEGYPQNKAIIFDTKGGELTAKRVGYSISLNFPAIKVSKTNEFKDKLHLLNLHDSTEVLTCGEYYLIKLGSVSDVKSVTPDFQKLKDTAKSVIITAEGKELGVDFVSRCFAPFMGINEDPVTGAAHCRLATYWSDILNKKHFIAKQVSMRGGDLSVRLLPSDRVELQGRAILVEQDSLPAPNA